MNEEMNDLLDQHKEKFGDIPNTFMIDEELEDKIVSLLKKAIDDDQELTTEAMYKSLGVEPPPEDADI